MKRLIILAVLLLVGLSGSSIAYTDYKCLVDCVGRGMTMGYCQKLCEY